MTDPFLTRAGSRIHVEDSSGPVILAIHGLGGGAWFFDDVAAILAASAPASRLIAVDLPGTGRSTAATGPSIDRWVDDLGDLVAGRVAAPVVILGHSMGTIVALRAWRAWPERIAAMVFVGGLPEPRPAIRQRLAERAEAVARTGLAGLGAQVAEVNVARATAERQPALIRRFAGHFESQDARSYVQCCHVLLNASASDLVSTVTVPCLSITGAEDQYAPPELVAEFTARIPGPHRVEVMPDCGHLPFLEQPDAFVARLRPFLRTVC